MRFELYIQKDLVADFKKLEKGERGKLINDLLKVHFGTLDIEERLIKPKYVTKIKPSKIREDFEPITKSYSARKKK